MCQIHIEAVKNALSLPTSDKPYRDYKNRNDTYHNAAFVLFKSYVITQSLFFQHLTPSFCMFLFIMEALKTLLKTETDQFCLNYPIGHPRSGLI